MYEDQSFLGDISCFLSTNSMIFGFFDTLKVCGVLLVSKTVENFKKKTNQFKTKRTRNPLFSSLSVI